MLRVELSEEVMRRGKWRWTCSQYGVEGVSRQPLLDACREIQRMGGNPAQAVGMFWLGKDRPSLTCTVGTGAGLTVNEDGPRFAKWKPPNLSLREAA